MKQNTKYEFFITHFETILLGFIISLIIFIAYLVYYNDNQKNYNVTCPQPNGQCIAVATTPMTQNQIETLAEQLGVPKTQQAVTKALQQQKNANALPAATMTQNQIETLAEQLGVPKTQQAVTKALQQQKNANALPAATINYGKVALASQGPGVSYPVSSQFESSPYFIIFDPTNGSYILTSNPNINYGAGQGTQIEQYMANLGVRNVIAGAFEQNTLNNMRFNIYPGVIGSGQDVLTSYLTGKLLPIKTHPSLQNAHPIYLAAVKNQVYYEPTIKNIIMAKCARCHSGATRNLMDYDNLKTYSDSGLLSNMVQGPMYRFAGNDAKTIVDWVNNGAPEKPQTANQVNFMGGFGGQRCPVGIQSNIPLDQITYTNTIKNVLNRDCLSCHSGQFRNLTTYKNVKMYADNGLLKKLVQLGGPMHRFAGPDSHLIIAWVDNGAPR
ncbi:MAG: NifB/NifX family molybdenum-iron cluster-binding protein [Desulfobacterales bacterium]|nr:NifB/NifX family molybdenum-iron cluster-binding protein [Desulfobacterales bacterium]